MNRWYKIPDQTKVNAYNKIAEETGMSAFAVEKDWWVVQSLSIILNTQIGSSLVFKGGTLFSIAWGFQK